MKVKGTKVPVLEAPHMDVDRIGYHNVCSICYQPVSRRQDKADLRVEREDGGFDHVECRNRGPTPAERLLLEIFGGDELENRQRFAATQAGSLAGHTVTFPSGGMSWICSCGITGKRGPYENKRSLKRAAEAHQRQAFALDGAHDEHSPDAP